jgi:hypothetical protein
MFQDQDKIKAKEEPEAGRIRRTNQKPRGRQQQKLIVEPTREKKVKG